jgi:hypothetical protein
LYTCRVFFGLLLQATLTVGDNTRRQCAIHSRIVARSGLVEYGRNM